MFLCKKPCLVAVEWHSRLPTTLYCLSPGGKKAALIGDAAERKLHSRYETVDAEILPQTDVVLLQTQKRRGAQCYSCKVFK